MKTTEERFLQYLAGRGHRITRQRRLIAAALSRSGGHLSAEALCDLVRRDDPSVSRASVYRTLDLLSRGGLVEGSAFAGSRKLYEPTTGRAHHDHLVCTRCGAVVEFANPGIEAAQRAVAGRHGFEIHSHSLEIYGLCRDCRDRAARKKSKRKVS